MSTYPRTIRNGAGEQITFFGVVEGPAGDRLELENLVTPGSGPPMHVHHRQRESLTVRRGRMGYQRPGKEPQFAEEGATLVFPPGEPHRFWNAGEEDLLCVGYIEPPDNVEYFLTEIYASQARNGGARPDPFEAAYLTHRYRSEFEMTEMPAFVQRFIFPLLVLLGRLLGRYGRYANAPEPIMPVRR